MITSAKMNQNLKQGIITEEMLELVLYSINKRAKNCRDKKREYRQKYDKYNNCEKYEIQEQEYYSQKNFLLSTLLIPTCIHCETIINKRKERIYDYQGDYETYVGQGYWENYYYDNEKEREIYFVDVPYDEKTEKYYLFYKMVNHSFHTPITSSIPYENDYEVIKIDRLVTYGNEVEKLISQQFCKKLIELVKQQNYTYLNT